MNYRNMPGGNATEKSILLKNIDMVGFAMVELAQYLDTHPDDEEAMEYFMHFMKNKKMLMKEYTLKYGPLCLDNMNDRDLNKWKWATEPMPWEGVC